MRLGWCAQGNCNLSPDRRAEPGAWIPSRTCGIGSVVAGGDIIEIIGSTGGLIEHYVYYIAIPSGFVLITFVEVLLQTLIFGQLLLLWEKQFNRAFYADM